MAGIQPRQLRSSRVIGKVAPSTLREKEVGESCTEMKGPGQLSWLVLPTATALQPSKFCFQLLKSVERDRTDRNIVNHTHESGCESWLL